MNTAHTFRRIALLGREGNQSIIETLTNLIQHLSILSVEVVLETSTAALLQNTTAHQVIDAEQLSNHSDLLIVVGGDGSLLNAAHIAAAQNLPVLGVNRGQLGFLTDISPENLEEIDAVIAGQYREENRFLLSGNVTYGEEVLSEGVALNDIILLRGDIVRTAHFDIAIDGTFVCSQRADGLIVATPTGSTAYALSASGPIIHPKLDALVLAPMFPHNLTSRPIVAQGNSMIEIVISKDNTTELGISYDGGQRIETLPESKITIQKYTHPLRLIHPTHYDYFDTLRTKLHWEYSL